MEVKRMYEHKTFGAIGAVTLAVDGGKWLMDGRELSPSSVEHLMTFALQTLQDAYAGAKTEAEAKAAFEKKRDRLLAGEIGVRTGGGTDDVTKVWRSVAKAVLRRVAPDKWKEWKDDDAKLDAFVEKNRAKLQPAFDEEMLSRKRRADALAGIEL